MSQIRDDFTKLADRMALNSLTAASLFVRDSDKTALLNAIGQQLEADTARIEELVGRLNKRLRKQLHHAPFTRRPYPDWMRRGFVKLHAAYEQLDAAKQSRARK